jgi:hypothetical protein
MEFVCRISKDGGFNFGDHERVRFKQYLRDHPDALLKISPVLPESRKLRRFYHGAVLPLWAFLDGKDYRSADVLADLHEVAKLEFNGHLIEVGGKPFKIGKSTRDGALRGYVERVIEYLMESYGVDPSQVLNPEQYKYFMQAVFMHGQYEDYISYLIAEGRLKRTTQ